jgi:hypothetical protein
MQSLSRDHDPAAIVSIISNVCMVATNTLPKPGGNEEDCQEVRHEYAGYSWAYWVSFLANDPLGRLRVMALRPLSRS